MTDQCEAEVYDGTASRQCAFPASGERDGRRVCGRHARKRTGGARWFGEDAAPVSPVGDKPAEPRAADDVLADLTTIVRFAFYGTADRILQAQYAADAWWGGGKAALATRGTEDRLRAQCVSIVTERCIAAALELADGGMDDATILDRVRSVIATA